VCFQVLSEMLVGIELTSARGAGQWVLFFEMV